MRLRRLQLFATPRGKALQAVVLCVIALLFGGGGSGAGLLNLVVQLSAIVIIAFNPQSMLDFFKSGPRLLILLVSAALFLPLLQSLPLPPAIWQRLPGRDLISDSVGLFGKQEEWFPLSVNVRRTVTAFLSLLPPLAIVALTWRLPQDEKRKLFIFVVVAGLFVVLLGAQQLATGNRQFVFFSEAFGSGDLQGTFANRNAAGIFIDIALCALTGSFFGKRPKLFHILISGTAILFLLAGLVLTRSRSSMALVFIPVMLLLFVILRSWKGRAVSNTRLIVLIPLLATIMLGAFLSVSQPDRIRNSLSRFENFQDARPAIWSDTLGSISRFWPVGSGVGTFDEVFQVDESLETLRSGRAARAHNEYLEVAVESGLFGVILLVSWAIYLLTLALRATMRRSVSLTAAAVFALLALQSLLDYPLRNQTLLCIAGLMLAVFVEPPAASGGRGGPGARGARLGTS